jgi:hypothetical protein
MMHYYQDSDRLVALHYAQQLSDIAALKIIERGEIGSPEEAKILSKFYWAMVKASVEDRDDRGCEPFENMNESLEGLHNTFSISIGNAGYEDVWDAIVDEID